jgi:hypothetical protein
MHPGKWTSDAFGLQAGTCLCDVKHKAIHMQAAALNLFALQVPFLEAALVLWLGCEIHASDALSGTSLPRMYHHVPANRQTVYHKD